MRSRVVDFFRKDRVRRVVAWLGLGLLIVLVLSIVIQLLFPRSISRATVVVAGQKFHWADASEIEKFAKKQLPKTKARLTIDNKPKDIVLSDLGGEYCVKCITEEAMKYDWGERFVPFSLLWRVKVVDEARVDFKEKPLERTIQPLTALLSRDPQDATIKITKSQAKIISSKDGLRVTKADVVKAIKKAGYKLGKSTKIHPSGKTIEPSVKDSHLVATKDVINRAINRPLSIKYEDRVKEVSKETVASWLRFAWSEDGTPQASFDEEAVGKFVDDEFSDVSIASGVTTVNLVDGVEQSRQEGSLGRGADKGALLEYLDKSLSDDSAKKLEVGLLTVELQPKVNYSESFSSSQQGLQAYLNSLSRDFDIRVSISQLDGPGWQAESRGGELSVAASTYKLYVAIYVLDKVKNGEWSMNDTINGLSTSECLSKMIVQSDNACPEAFLAKFGRSNINSYLYARGFSRATSFTNSEYSSTGTNDLVKVLRGIEGGSLVSGFERDFLLDLMARQVYRQGVPAGSSAQVYDKVGFLWGYLNDAAIVRHPRGTYAIGIITNNQSWTKIAEITRKIEQIMYP